MPSVSIKYVAEGEQAEISTDQLTPGWAELRRACEERALGLSNKSETSFVMAWWELLSIRETLRYFLNKHGLTLQADNKAAELLKSAASKEANYSATPVAVTAEALAAKLGAEGFVRQLTTQQSRNVLAITPRVAAAEFSVPGAGKTTSALAYFAYHKTAESKLLIVCPKNAFPVWEEQLAICFPQRGLKFQRLRGGASNIKKLMEDPFDVAVVSYHQFATARREMGELLGKHQVIAILDESHRIKGGTDMKTGNAVLALSYLPYRKLVLSGTPLPNAIGDLVPQFKFLYPEVRADEDNVADLIHPIYVRTTKAELGLPPVTRRIREIPMSSAQRQLYEALRSETFRQGLKGFNASDRNKLRALGRSVMRLLQVASNTALLARSELGHYDLFQQVAQEGDSPKIEYVCGRARELAKAGRKVVIWSTFVGNVELIAQRLADLGADFIHGAVEAGSDTEEDTREGKIRRFHLDPGAFVLVANPAACAESISLHTVCHDAIYLDRSYNAAQYLQSEDRIHRLGLPPETKTNVEVVVCPDSIDEMVDVSLKRKVATMARILDDSSLHIETVSPDFDDAEDIGLDKTDIDALIDHLRA